MHRSTSRMSSDSHVRRPATNDRTSGRRGTARRRLRTLEALCVLAVAASLILAAALSGAGRPHEVSSVTAVRVQKAQTLWELASDHPVPGQETLQTIETIRELNGLGDRTLLEGTVVLVPAPEPSRSQLAAR